MWRSVVRRIALTVLLASALALAGGGVVAAEPGHDRYPGHHGGTDWLPKTIDLPDGFQPEGISIGKRGAFYVGSVATGAIYRGSVLTGQGAVLVEGAEPTEEPRAAIGTEVDNRNRLWVAGGGTGVARVYDAESGRELKEYVFVDVADPAATPTFINDVVVTRDAAYFTDSLNQVLYVVPIGRGGQLADAGDFDVLSLEGDLQYEAGFNLNGIEASADGRTLLVVQSNTGLLFKVSARSGITTQVDLGDELLLTGDGLLLQRGSTLYVVRNGFNLIAVVKLDRSFGSGRLVDTITDEDFDVPTTVAAFGKYLYAVNARFDVENPDSATYSVVRVDARR
jgi:sugar lactone lactonase YvrE